MIQIRNKHYRNNHQLSKLKHTDMKNFKKISICLLLLLGLNGIALAQKEIPDKIKDKIANGIKYLENSKVPEDMDKAVKEFSEAAAIAPEFPDVHYYLGKTLSMMQGNAGKAVKELKKYLELYPDAPDKEKVNPEIAKLEDVIKTKKSSYLMGLSLIQLSDGIYIRQVNPNYPIDATSFRANFRVSQSPTGVKAGDKIVKINNTDIQGYSIEQVIKLIDEDNSLQSRVIRDGIDVSSKYRNITVMRGGRSFAIMMYKGDKKVNPTIRDLGEEDLATVISETKTPLVIFFMSDWCDLCEKYTGDIMGLGYKYKDAITLITVNIDENIYVAKEFNVAKAPVALLYKDGVLSDKIDGYENKLLSTKVEALMKNK